MILSKLYSVILMVCFLFLVSLLVTNRYTEISFDDRMKEDLRRLKMVKSFDKIERTTDGDKVKPLIANYQKSNLFRAARRNVRWNKNGRNLLAKLSTNRVKITAYSIRQHYPLPPENAVLKVAWFSMRTFWKERHYPVMFPCDTGKVILSKADQDISKLREVDVVLFAGGFENEELWRQLREERDPGQLWLFNTDESPLTAKTHIPPYRYRDITFNITFTYRSNADIKVPYGFFVKNESLSSIPNGNQVNFHERSPKLAAWMSSHCDTIAWNRTGFVWDLSRYIPIDKYGSCGNLTCGNSNKYWERVVNNQCKRILRKYKFHFALENSCCAEYISEKFWNILRHYDAIPVVIGAPKEDYERIAPPNSFIYAADFDSMEKLAEYLQTVASDPEKFNSYFQWKYEGQVRGNHEKQRRIGYSAANCRILEYLQTPNLTQARHDLHGPSWLGGCSECGDRKILKSYRNSGYNYVQN